MIVQIFANALVRRVAAIIAVVLLAWVGSAKAQVGDYPYCTTRTTPGSAEMCPDQGEAVVNAYRVARANIPAGGSIDPAPFISGNLVRVYVRSRTGGLVSSGDRQWPSGKTCANRVDWNGPYPYLTGGIPRNGSVTCNSGCKQAWYSTGDGYFNGKYTSVPGVCDSYDDSKCKADFGSGYYFNAAMSSCEPDDGKCKDGAPTNSLGQCAPEPCPEGKVQNADGTCENKKNECPAGNVKAPSGECLPGEGQCAQGEAKGKDGTCKRDSNGDGVPDSEEGEDDPDKDSASGGENCNAPPSCNGNPIMCLQLRTQWRIDCNTRRDRNVTGGSCGAMPVCVGQDCDAQEHAQLIQQWKAACALDKLANRTGDGGGDDGQQPEWTKVGGMNQDPGAGATSGDAPKLNVIKMSTDSLDQSGFGGGSCIGFAAGGGSGISSGFMQTLASPPPLWCNFIAMVKAVFILVGACASVFILAKGAG